MTNDLGKFLEVGQYKPVHQDVTNYRVTFFVVTPDAVNALHALGLDGEFTQVNSTFGISGLETEVLGQDETKARVCSELSYNICRLIAEALIEMWGKINEPRRINEH